MASPADVPEIMIILIAGLTVFGLIFIADAANLGDFGSSEPDKMVLLNKNFGQVGDSRSDLRTIELGDFTVGEARGNVRAYQRDKATVSDTVLGGQKIKFSYNATQPRHGKVSFEVLGRQGKGEVFVKVNNQEIFAEHLVATGSPEITVPSQALKPGVNKFVIGVNRPGYLGKTEYALEEVEATVNDRKFHDYEDNFQMYNYEIAGFTSATLSFEVADSIKTSPLEISVNDQEIYSKDQLSGPDKVGISPQKGDLHVGGNAITFSTRQPAMYAIKNAQITTKYIGNSQEERLTSRFEMNNSALRFARRDNTDEYIRFNYQSLLPSAEPLTVTLNGNETTLVPANGQNTIEIEAAQLREENTVTISSPGTYQLGNFRVVSEKVE